MLWDVLNLFSASWVAMVASISLVGRVWYWLDDNDTIYRNYILFGMAKQMSKIDNTDDTDVENTYDFEDGIVITLGVIFLANIVGVVIEAFGKSPILVISTISIPMILFATRYVIRLNKKVDEL